MMNCGSGCNSDIITRKLGRKWKRQAQFTRLVDTSEPIQGVKNCNDKRRRQLLARVCNFFLEEHEQGCSRKMAEISEYLKDTQTKSDVVSLSEEDIHVKALEGLGFNNETFNANFNEKKNTIVKVCDFFLDKKERGNEINIRAIITAIDHASSTSALTPAEKKAVEEKQRELLVKVCKIFLDTKERGVEANIQEIWNAIRHTRLNDTHMDKNFIDNATEELHLDSTFEVEKAGRSNLNKSSEFEKRKRKMVVYKFFLDSGEKGMEDKTKQINQMLLKRSESELMDMT